MHQTAFNPPNCKVCPFALGGAKCEGGRVPNVKTLATMPYSYVHLEGAGISTSRRTSRHNARTRRSRCATGGLASRRPASRPTGNLKPLAAAGRAHAGDQKRPGIVQNLGQHRPGPVPPGSIAGGADGGRFEDFSDGAGEAVEGGQALRVAAQNGKRGPPGGGAPPPPPNPAPSLRAAARKPSSRSHPPRVNGPANHRSLAEERQGQMAVRDGLEAEARGRRLPSAYAADGRALPC